MSLWKEELIHNAIEFQAQGIKTLADSAYIAVAQLKEAPLITNDSYLLKEGKKIYPAIFSLKEWVEWLVLWN